MPTEYNFNICVVCLNVSRIVYYVKLEKLFGGIRVKNAKVSFRVG